MASNHTPCGIELPQVFFDGPVDMEHIRKFATRAETLGFDSHWLQERIIGDFAMLEPVTLLDTSCEGRLHSTPRGIEGSARTQPGAVGASTSQSRSNTV